MRNSMCKQCVVYPNLARLDASNDRRWLRVADDRDARARCRRTNEGTVIGFSRGEGLNARACADEGFVRVSFSRGTFDLI